MDIVIIEKLNYWVFIILMMLGLWAMLSKNNLIKKVMGMAIFQSAVIMFYVSIGTKDEHASIPIYPHDLIHPHHDEAANGSDHGEAVHASHNHDSVDHGDSENAHADHHHDELSAHDEHAKEVHKDHSTHDAKAHDHDEHGHSKEAHDGEKYGSDKHHGSHHEPIASKVNPDDYDNPLPHVLMLTAIVVGVATLGVALSLVQRLYRQFGTIEESEILEALEKDDEILAIAEMKASEDNPPTTHA
jgi:multicomponent Na+:H+ antiporter subunit C